jgi:hypothetical protein
VRRHAAAVLIAFAAATSVIGSTAPPVSAECPFGDAPWPEITPAIRSARSILVGDVVTDFTNADLHLGADQGPRDYALRVTRVVRGEMRPGDLLDIQFLLPNWPQTHYSGADGPSPSCSYMRASPGEVIALAFDALHPGGPMSANGEEWIQPPTRYHAVGVIKGPGGTFGTGAYRERVTLRQLRALASLPPTDTVDPMAADRVPLDSGARSMLVAAGLVGLWLGWRRFSARREVDQRVALDGVRRSER